MSARAKTRPDSYCGFSQAGLAEDADSPAVGSKASRRLPNNAVGPHVGRSSPRTPGIWRVNRSPLPPPIGPPRFHIAEEWRIGVSCPSWPGSVACSPRVGALDQILGDKQQRTIGRASIQQLAHFPQHADLAHAGELAAKSLPLGCMLSHGSCSSHVGATPRNSSTPRITPAQCRQRFQNRKVGLAGAVVLDALPARDSDVARRHEAFDQRGLADARFAGDPHDRRWPPRAPCQAQFALERIRAADRSGAGRPRPSGAGARVRRWAARPRARR